MNTEFDALQANSTWELSELPPGRKAIGCKWVFRVKEDSEGNMARYKARLVAQEFTQQLHFDDEETFAPVLKHSTFRILVAVAAAKNFELKQLDVETAYLHSKVEEEIYMRQPPGYTVESKDNKTLFCKLHRSLYGLKQSGRNWNRLLHGWLTKNGFKRSSSDYCLYTCTGPNFFAIGVYVDDIITVAEDPSQRETFVKQLGSTFKIQDLGLLSWCLGIKIEQRAEAIVLHQSKYVEDMLQQYSMQDSKPQATPAINVRLTREDSPKDGSAEAQHMQQVPYRSLAGSLNYAAVCTRPDVAFAVGEVCAHMNNPGERHWIAAKRVLRYLKGTSSVGIGFTKHCDELKLEGYSDSDWAGDIDTRRSTTGYIFTLAGGPISWSSKRQHTVALSSTEAEYMAITSSTQEAIFLRNILQDLGFEQTGPDNQSCIAMTLNPLKPRRTKHMDIRHHFVRDATNRGEVKASYLPTDKMPADCLTKPATAAKLKNFIDVIMASRKSISDFGRKAKGRVGMMLYSRIVLFSSQFCLPSALTWFVWFNLLLIIGSF